MATAKAVNWLSKCVIKKAFKRLKTFFWGGWYPQLPRDAMGSYRKNPDSFLMRKRCVFDNPIQHGAKARAAATGRRVGNSIRRMLAGTTELELLYSWQPRGDSSKGWQMQLSQPWVHDATRILVWLKETHSSILPTKAMLSSFPSRRVLK